MACDQHSMLMECFILNQSRIHISPNKSTDVVLDSVMDTIKNNGYIKKMENKKKNSLYYSYEQEQLFGYNKTYNYKKEKKILICVQE